MTADQRAAVFTGSAIEAEIARAMLQDNGIAAELSDEYLGSAAPFLASGGGAGAVKILVADQDVDRARRLLASHGRSD